MQKWIQNSKVSDSQMQRTRDALAYLQSKGVSVENVPLESGDPLLWVLLGNEVREREVKEYCKANLEFVKKEIFKIIQEELFNDIKHYCWICIIVFIGCAFFLCIMSMISSKDLSNNLSIINRQINNIDHRITTIESYYINAMNNTNTTNTNNNSSELINTSNSTNKELLDKRKNRAK